MRGRGLEQALIVAAVVYLVGVAWMMANLSYDLWGAFVVAPVLGLVGVWFLFRLFRGSQRPVAVILAWGLLAKLGGALARYWIGFETYGGSIDAQRYHEHALELTTRIRSGEESVWAALPRGTGTPFLENLTGFVYTFSGSSKLGGFLIFAFLGYVGVAFFVKAALVAVPGMAARRYAVLCAVAPSLVYWPSSIGKEAWMLLCLGLGTFGLAALFARRAFVISMAFVVAGFAGAAAVRPHMVAIWLAGVFPALLVTLMRGRGTGARRGGALDRVLIVGVIAVAAVALGAMSRVTLSYLDFADDTAATPDNITSVLAETTRRTAQAGSNFVPPAVESVTDWPYASLRTLTRPLLIESRTALQLVTSLELTLLFGLFLLWWRRVKQLPWAMVTIPYVAFAMSTLFLVGLAFSSFANLGVLARQKSLVFPFLLLIPCLPVRPMRRRNVEAIDAWRDHAPIAHRHLADEGERVGVRPG